MSEVTWLLSITSLDSNSSLPFSLLHRSSLITDVSRKNLPQDLQRYNTGWGRTDKSCSVLSGEECEQASLPVPRGLSSNLKWAHIFQEQWWGGGSFTNPWEWQTSYLGTAVTKAARGERMGAFSARKVFLSSLPRRIYERKVVTKRRMGRWIRIRQWADFWASSWNTKGRWGISAKAPNNQPLPCATKQWLGQCSASPRCSTEHCYSLRPYPTSKNKRKESV